MCIGSGGQRIQQRKMIVNVKRMVHFHPRNDNDFTFPLQSQQQWAAVQKQIISEHEAKQQKNNSDNKQSNGISNGKRTREQRGDERDTERESGRERVGGASRHENGRGRGVREKMSPDGDGSEERKVANGDVGGDGHVNLRLARTVGAERGARGNTGGVALRSSVVGAQLGGAGDSTNVRDRGGRTSIAPEVTTRAGRRVVPRNTGFFIHACEQI